MRHAADQEIVVFLLQLIANSHIPRHPVMLMVIISQYVSMETSSILQLCVFPRVTTIVSVLVRIHVRLKTWAQIIIAKWLLTGHKRSLGHHLQSMITLP